MSDKKISELNLATSLADADILAVVQSNETKQIPASTVKNYTNTSPTLYGGSINNTPIGATNASTGAFTTLSSTSTTTLNGTSIPSSKTLVDTNSTQTLTGKTLNSPNELAYQISASTYPSIRPSLLLDFANTKALDPRITFSRASTGTYYDGSVAMAEQNLLTYSQDFTNAIWNKTAGASAITVTGAAATAPDGSTTACLLYPASSSANAFVIQPQSTNGSTYTFSVYLKASGINAAWLYVYSSASYGTYYISLADGTTQITSGATSTGTLTVTTLANGWYRLALTNLTPNASNVNFGIGPCDAKGSIAVTASGTNGIYVWGAQLEQRSSVTAYNVTTTAPITNYIPVLKTAAANVPRFDTNPTTGESLGLFIEEQRTNLLTYSSAFDNAAWTKTACSITAAANIAPDGTLTAQKLVEDTTNATHYIRESVSVTSGLTYTLTIYAKAAERTYAAITASGVTLGGLYAYFNLSNGTIGTSSGGLVAKSITAVGNGWYRCSITATAVSSGTAYFDAYTASADNTASYTGNGYSGILIWGAQLEIGGPVGGPYTSAPFATSYIPTLASQVTRSADSASMTGTNFSSWFNSQQGSLCTECAWANSSSSSLYPVSINDATGSAANRIAIVRSTNSHVYASDFYNSTNYALLDLGTANNATSSKVAHSYSSTASIGSLSGATSVSGSATSSPANIVQMNIGNQVNTNYLNGTIKRLSYYPVALTSAQLQALTSI